MSYTELFGFDKNGDAFYYSEVRNAWRGGMAIWQRLEEKYLPINECKKLQQVPD